MQFRIKHKNLTPEPLFAGCVIWVGKGYVLSVSSAMKWKS